MYSFPIIGICLFELLILIQCVNICSLIEGERKRQIVCLLQAATHGKMSHLVRM